MSGVRPIFQKAKTLRIKNMHGHHACEAPLLRLTSGKLRNKPRLTCWLLVIFRSCAVLCLNKNKKICSKKSLKCLFLAVLRRLTAMWVSIIKYIYVGHHGNKVLWSAITKSTRNGKCKFGVCTHPFSVMIIIVTCTFLTLTLPSSGNWRSLPTPQVLTKAKGIP